MTEFEDGKMYYPNVPEPVVSDTLIRDAGWKIELLGEVYVLSFMAARHGGGVDRYNITKEEFNAVREGKPTGRDLITKYDSIADAQRI